MSSSQPQAGGEWQSYVFTLRIGLTLTRKAGKMSPLTPSILAPAAALLVFPPLSLAAAWNITFYTGKECNYNTFHHSYTHSSSGDGECQLAGPPGKECTWKKLGDRGKSFAVE